MRYTVPDYYKKFKCLASDCPATCCAGWQIMIDDKSLKKYASCPGIFGNRLVNSINWEEERFKQYHSRCAFLNEQNLCDIHLEKGSDFLCRTCRRYPKHVEVYENEREISLSLSCPMVARLLLAKTDQAQFLTTEKVRKNDGDQLQKSDDDFDEFLYSALQDCRSVLIAMAQNRNEALNLRMAKILSLAHDVQNRIDSRQLFDTENVLERYQREGADTALAHKLIWFSLVNEEFCGENDEQRADSDYLSVQWRVLDYLRDFEVLDPRWVLDLQRWRKALYGEGPAVYLERKKRFLTEARVWETEYEQILVYFLFVYFCGAVYDGDALRKAKMAVMSVRILRELAFAQWILAGEKLTAEDRAELAWRYARELEHSDPNLNAMERMMEEWKESDFEVLILLLMGEM
ncbi:MAG: flagellin lysine-N-methylase [Lachnospiraceae bacterium]|nr:flagellin lysine-N-methylase [Lachnospiraceae bacterium]